MKRLLTIVVMLCTAACAVGFWMVGGSQFLQLQAGPESLGIQETIEQAEGKYLSYEAAYPVASYVEEYYSGDPDRVRRTGYVVYDNVRKAFVYVVVSERNDGRLENLLWNLKLAVELRAGKDMSPYMADGTLKKMDSDAAAHAAAALEESEIIEFYRSTEGQAAYRESYFGDEYGQVIADLCDGLEENPSPADWYCIEDGVVDGLEKGDIWVCILAAGVSLLIAIVSLISLFTGGMKKKVALPADSGSKMEGFFLWEKTWAEAWCEYNLKRGYRLACLSVVISLAIFVAIGVYLKMPATKMAAFYVPLGVLCGEVVGAMFWYGQKGQSNVAKILKKHGKNIKKELPSAAEQEAFAEDILNTGKEWEFEERTKEGMLWGTVGSRYWVALHWNGRVMLVDSEKLGKIETETIAGTVRSGKVRVSYQSHAVRFYYKSAAPKKTCDQWIGFDSKENQRQLLALARKRVGENVEYMML